MPVTKIHLRSEWPYERLPKKDLPQHLAWSVCGHWLLKNETRPMFSFYGRTPEVLRCKNCIHRA